MDSRVDSHVVWKRTKLLPVFMSDSGKVLVGTRGWQNGDSDTQIRRGRVLLEAKEKIMVAAQAPVSDF